MANVGVRQFNQRNFRFLWTECGDKVFRAIYYGFSRQNQPFYFAFYRSTNSIDATFAMTSGKKIPYYFYFEHFLEQRNHRCNIFVFELAARPVAPHLQNFDRWRKLLAYGVQIGDQRFFWMVGIVGCDDFRMHLLSMMKRARK